MNRPLITIDELTRMIRQQRSPEENALLSSFPGFLFGIRGYYLRTMGKPDANDRNIYDDAIGYASRDGRFYGVFNGNTDPSVYRKGIATLVPGVHIYRKGGHGISKGNPYPAFRPASEDESVPVRRDGDDKVSKGIAINIHRGGTSTTSSLGCQTIFPSQWETFQKAAYALMTEYGMKTIPYVLVEERK